MLHGGILGLNPIKNQPLQGSDDPTAAAAVMMEWRPGGLTLHNLARSFEARVLPGDNSGVFPGSKAVDYPDCLPFPASICFTPEKIISRNQKT